MADAARIGSLAGETPQSGHVHRPARPQGRISFQHLLSRALNGKVVTGGQATSGVQAATRALRPGVSYAAARVPAPMTTKPAAALPGSTDAALSQAMTLEGVPASWQDSLRFIVDKESSGRVDARNPVHSARGLFQLTAANYHLNPKGAASFGNAVEEAQGGIRYIKQRYGTADNAVAFWHQHHWY